MRDQHTATFRGVPEELKEEFKIVCFAKKMKMGEVICELMRWFIENPSIVRKKQTGEGS